MNQKYSLEDCYKILNSNSDLSWNELRTTYKLQIQKWHPDRYNNESNQKIIAEVKIRELNSAFQQLSKYYKKNGTLPKIELQRSTTTDKARHNTKPAPKPKPEQPIKQSTYKQKEKKSRIMPVLISICIVIFVYSAIDSPNQTSPTQPDLDNPLTDDKYQDQDFNELTETAVDAKGAIDSDPNKENLEQEEIAHIKFTYGSSIGSVLSIQGVPTKSEGDTWYYGESKVHFHNGVVQSWERKAGHPLNASIKP